MSGPLNPRKTWPLILAVLAVGLVWAGRTHFHFSNYTGLVVFPSLQVVRVLPDGPARGSGVEVNDKIRSIDGVPVTSFSDFFRFLRDRTLTGKVVALEVERDGRALTFPLLVEAYPVLHLSLFGPGFGLLLLVFGLYVYFRCPDERTRGLYLSLNVCLFVLLSLSNHILKQASAPTTLLLWGFALIAVVPLNLHFYLLFPEPKGPIRDRPWLAVFLYVLPAVFLALLLVNVRALDAAIGSGADSMPAFDRVRRLFVNYFFLGVFSCVGFVASLVHALLTAPSPLLRRQVQVVLIGAFTTLLLAAPVTYALMVFLTEPERAALWPVWAYPALYAVIVAATVILPLSMAVSILRYRLWDLDMAIHRSLTYMGVSVSLIAIYLGILGVAGWALGRMVSPSSQGAALVFALTTAAVAEPLRRQVKRAVDRTFNREAIVYRRTLRSFSRELVQMRRLDEIAAGLSQVVTRALGASNVVAVLQEGEATAFAPVAAACGFGDEGRRAVLSGPEALCSLLGTNAGAFEPQGLLPQANLAPGARSWLETVRRLGVHLVVPIRRTPQLLGWIALGEKRSGSLYSGQDRELLETLADQAAVAVENARAFERIERLNRDLREKIEKVEEQQAEILVLQERLLGENRCLKEQIRGEYDFTEIVGAGDGLKGVMEVAARAAATDATVLITGETGTGKELIARAIHYNSDRREGPFIPVNCAALAEGLLLSELFGHERGAFTGAHERRVGRFELAAGGSIFLDEIGDVSQATQVALLRVLQDRTFERLGGSETLQARVRVIAATNRCLEEAVRRGSFRADLYYRLKVITVEVPPLRERGRDVFRLAMHFVDRYARKYGKPITQIEEEAMNRLKAYSWPGNVRELENVLERSIVLCQGPALEVRDIPVDLQARGAEEPVRPGDRAGAAGALASHRDMIREMEVRRLREALERAGGNKSEAARWLGLKRSTFFNKLKKYALLD